MLDKVLEASYEWPVAIAIREGDWLFPMIESVHVLAITLVVGTILIVDLRLLGYAAHRSGAGQLIRDMTPWTWAAFSLAVLSGLLLFVSNAPTYWSNTFFQLKMYTIVAAGLNMAWFHRSAFRTVGSWDERLPPPPAARIAGLASLVLWIAVIAFGRWIGFTLKPF